MKILISSLLFTFIIFTIKVEAGCCFHMPFWDGKTSGDTPPLYRCSTSSGEKCDENLPGVYFIPSPATCVSEVICCSNGKGQILPIDEKLVEVDTQLCQESISSRTYARRI